MAATKADLSEVNELRAVFSDVVMELSAEEVAYARALPNLKERLKNAVTSPHQTAKQLEFWRQFYLHGSFVSRAGFPLVDFPRSIRIPPLIPGFENLVVIPQGLTLAAAAAACKECFPVYVPAFLLTLLQDFEVASLRTQAVWMSNAAQEPNLEGRIRGASLTEWLLAEIAFYFTTGKHLAEGRSAFCGSPTVGNGGRPIVRWSKELERLEVNFGRYDPKLFGTRIWQVID